MTQGAVMQDKDADCRAAEHAWPNDPFRPSRILMHSPLAQSSQHVESSGHLRVPGAKGASEANGNGQQSCPTEQAQGCSCDCPADEVQAPLEYNVLEQIESSPEYVSTGQPLQDIRNRMCGPSPKDRSAGGDEKQFQTPPSVSRASGQKRRRQSLVSPSNRQANLRSKRLMCGSSFWHDLVLLKQQ
jgi:hypothetical protein